VEEKTMEYETVIYEKEGHIAHIILNRPAKLNTVSPELIRDWEAAMKEGEDDDDVKVIIIKGAGRCFSAGADLSGVGFVYGMKEPKPGQKMQAKPGQRVRLNFDRNLFYDFHRKLLLCRKITIAQMHEYCLGIAFNLALHCDLLIAAEDCKVGHVEERLGLGGMTVTPIMVLRCGLTRALELCLTGKMITGAEAAQFNLVNRAVPKERLEAEVQELAAGLALYPKDGIALGKATRHLLYETMGVEKGLVDHFIMHSFQTNRVYEADEFNFFKQRRDKGVKEAAHGKHKFFEKLDK
jgi:enoyl-CoA hydratase